MIDLFARPAFMAIMLWLCTGSLHAADIKVGSAGGVTGSIAEMVASIIKGRALAATQVNQDGGLLNGDLLKLVVADSACDPKAAVDAGNKLVNVEQVVAIVGPSCSGATNAMVSSVTIPAGVVVVSDSATAPSISELKDNDTVFRVAPSDAYQAIAIANLVHGNRVRKIAVTYANDDYNSGIAAEFVRAFERLGGSITANQAHAPNKASYRAELASLSGRGAQGLALFAYYGSSGITIIKNSLENGLFARFYAADGMFDKTLIKQLGAANVAGRVRITQATSDTEGASYKAFAQAFRAVGGNPKAPYAAHGYDATFLVALAIEKAGSAQRNQIAAALRQVASPPGEIIRPGEWSKAKGLIAAGQDINYEGAAGVNDFDASGDVTGLYSVNVAGKDGNWIRTPLK